jgi:signal transduction histidine kinase
MCIVGGALTWLCWRLLDQDRQLESQRTRERLEQAADRTAAALASSIEGLDAWLPLTADANMKSPPPGLVLLLKNETGTAVWPAGSLAYLPPPSPRQEKDFADAFAAGEHLEFQEHDFAGAADRFRLLAGSRDAAVRAGALLRLGRNLRKLNRYGETLGVYTQLAALKNASIEGVPAELMALDARCSVLEVMGRRSELQQQALLIDAGLRTARWGLTGGAWEFYRSETSRWAATTALTASERQALAISRAAEWIDQRWPPPLEPVGRHVVDTPEGPVLVSWSADASRLAAVLAPPDRFQTIWKSAQADPGASAALIDANGNLVVGSVSASGLRTVRSPAVAGMAAALHLTLRDPAAGLAAAAMRRRFLVAGFILLALVLAGGSYFMTRYMARESAVARMQAEFVATVSHEFRTPLTSIRQMSEMLARDRIAAENERHEAYNLLIQSSERLQRLVESLLDFGRMEAATFRYRFDELDVRALVDEIVSAFRLQAAQEHEVLLDQAAEVPAIRGDREALGIALWNLLDNAVKYSPGRETVWVETKPESGGVAIAVRDEGPGIERDEQERIFDKFARGSDARNSNIKGTGIGLSMARHIACAHGGEIRLASQPGSGSTFTLFLPVERQA